LKDECWPAMPSVPGSVTRKLNKISPNIWGEKWPKMPKYLPQSSI
jgi:hypothetical protein